MLDKFLAYLFVCLIITGVIHMLQENLDIAQTAFLGAIILKICKDGDI